MKMRQYIRGLLSGIAVIMFVGCGGGPPPSPLTFTLQRDILENVDDVAGRWQLEGGKVLQDGSHVAYYASTKRVVLNATSAQNTAMLTMTIFFIGDAPPKNITVQGSHDFNSGGQIGSVSAASSTYAPYIDAQFTRTGDTVTITP